MTQLNISQSLLQLDVHRGATCVMPPASPAATDVLRRASSKDVCTTQTAYTPQSMQCSILTACVEFSLSHTCLTETVKVQMIDDASRSRQLDDNMQQPWGGVRTNLAVVHMPHDCHHSWPGLSICIHLCIHKTLYSQGMQVQAGRKSCQVPQLAKDCNESGQQTVHGMQGAP